MKLMIQTQVQENYGAHDWDGVGVCPSYWKAKGGSEYKITNVPYPCDVEAIVDMVRNNIERSDDYFVTDIIGYNVEQDDYLSWFEKSQLDYEGTIQYKEPEIEYSDLKHSGV